MPERRLKALSLVHYFWEFVKFTAQISTANGPRFRHVTQNTLSYLHLTIMFTIAEINF